jgi:hypothetical protein
MGMKRTANKGIFIYPGMCAFALPRFCESSRISVNTATLMLPSTFGWPFHFILFPETKSQIINHNQAGLADPAGNQTNAWPMRKP